MTYVDVDPLAADPLAQRLSALHIDTPPHLLNPDNLTRALRRRPASHRVRVRLATGTGATAALVAANGGAAYFAPSYAHVLATAPGLSVISAPALRAAGLAAGDVAALHEVSTSQGITATLVGAYADGLRTTLFVQFDGIPVGSPAAPPSVTIGDIALTDQFGQHYALTGGLGYGVGAYPVDFEPLRGAAARVGARLTMEVAVVGMPGPAAAPGHERTPSALLGTIALHATVLPGAVRSLAAPAPVTNDGSTFAVLGIRASDNAVEVHTRISGSIVDRGLAAMAARSNYAYPGVFLMTPSGAYEIPVASAFGPKTRDTLYAQRALDETRVFARPGSGAFVIVITVDEPGPRAHALASWTIDIH